MFTIKIEAKDEGYRVIPAIGEISIHREGEPEFTAHCVTLENEHRQMVSDGVVMGSGQVKDPGYESPRAAIVYESVDDATVTSYIYAEDRAWIMNANGKTVATV